MVTTSLTIGDGVYFDWYGQNFIDHVSYDVGYGMDDNNNASYGWYGQLDDDHTSDPTTLQYAFWSHLATNSNWRTTQIFLLGFN